MGRTNKKRVSILILMDILLLHIDIITNSDYDEYVSILILMDILLLQYSEKHYKVL